MQVWLGGCNLEQGESEIFLSMNADVKIVHIQRKFLSLRIVEHGFEAIIMIAQVDEAYFSR